MAAASLAHLTLAFLLDGTFEEAVAVALREEGAALVVDYAGTDDEAAVRKQLGRILGLDVDGEALARGGAALIRWWGRCSASSRGSSPRQPRRRRRTTRPPGG